MIVTKPTTESLDKIELGGNGMPVWDPIRNCPATILRKPDGSYIIQTGDQDNPETYLITHEDALHNMTLLWQKNVERGLASSAIENGSY